MLTSRIAGKTEKSRGLSIKKPINKIVIARVMLMDRQKSIRNGGTGRIMMPRTAMTPIGRASCAPFCHSSMGGRNVLAVCSAICHFSLEFIDV